MSGSSRAPWHPRHRLQPSQGSTQCGSSWTAPRYLGPQPVPPKSRQPPWHHPQDPRWRPSQAWRLPASADAAGRSMSPTRGTTASRMANRRGRRPGVREKAFMPLISVATPAGRQSPPPGSGKFRPDPRALPDLAASACPFQAQRNGGAPARGRQKSPRWGEDTPHARRAFADPRASSARVEKRPWMAFSAASSPGGYRAGGPDTSARNRKSSTVTGSSGRPRSSLSWE